MHRGCPEGSFGTACRGLAWAWACCLGLGCASGESIYVHPQFHQMAPQQVALLPFENEALDLTAPEMLRKMAARKLSEWGYAVVALDRTDAELREIGVTDGGQLKAFSPERLAQKLGVDGLCYGIVEQFSFQNIGFYLKRSVGLRLRLLAASSGERLWEGNAEAVYIEIHKKREQAQRAFIRGWAQKAVENAVSSPLYGESREAVDKLFKKIPRRSG